MARKPLIPAVAYCRKSTKGKGADGKERQERSIPGQRQEIEKYAAVNGYRIDKWYIDDGVSGWKLDAKRPSFSQMIKEANDLGVSAVLCDDIDRFSRADTMQVMSDVQALKNAGVTVLALVNQGKYELSKMSIEKIIMFSFQANSSHEYSMKLSRRLSISRRNTARKGKRSGGMAPYGYKNDGAGSLIVDPQKASIVQKMFETYLSGARSLLSIADDLNKQGVPGPRGGEWTRETVKCLLTNRAYRGDFVYNRKQSGQFYFIDKAQEVRPAAERQHPNWLRSDEGVFIKEGTHPPLVSAETFDKVQATIESRKPAPRSIRKDGYALTGMLFCSHCGSPLWGFPRRGVKLYQCGSNNRKGNSVCHAYTIREDEILPFVLRRLKEELGIARMAALQPKPAKPFEPVPGRLEELQRQHDELAAKIKTGTNNLLLAGDGQLFIMLKEQLNDWLAEQRKLAAEIEAASEPQDQDAMIRYAREHVTWLKSHEDRLQKVYQCSEGEDPIKIETARKGKTAVTLSSPYITWEIPTLRQQLLELGTRVDLCWEPQQWGKRTIYQLAADKRCRFRMGQSSGPLPVPSTGKVMRSSAR